MQDEIGTLLREIRDNQREALANEILSNAIVPVIALTILAVGLVWFGISRMFAPLTELEHDLQARPPDDLSPVSVPVPVEVGHLVTALNGFMERLHKTMERVSGLVAEAAHEVRTPLASLRAQAEVAMDEQDPEALRRRVGRIHTGAVQASQLVGERRVDGRLLPGLVELLQRRDQRLGDVATAEVAEPTGSGDVVRPKILRRPGLAHRLLPLLGGHRVTSMAVSSAMRRDGSAARTSASPTSTASAPAVA